MSEDGRAVAPKKDEQGNVHWEPGDEARFYRCVAMAGKYAEARAPFESPKYAAIAVAHPPPLESRLSRLGRALPGACWRSRAFECRAYRQSGTAEIDRRWPKMQPTFFRRA